jgi:hypothetical protein
MKKLTLILIACLIAFLLNRYYPFASRKLILEYIFVAFLSFKFSELMNIKAVYKTPYLEVTN